MLTNLTNIRTNLWFCIRLHSCFGGEQCLRERPFC